MYANNNLYFVGNLVTEIYIFKKFSSICVWLERVFSLPTRLIFPLSSVIPFVRFTNIYEFSLFLKILCFISKGSLNIPEYRCLLIGRVLHLYTIQMFADWSCTALVHNKHAVENIAYFS